MISGIKILGEDSLLIEVEQNISVENLSYIDSLNKAIVKRNIRGIIEIVPAYASIALYFDARQISHTEFTDIIYELTSDLSVDTPTTSGMVWEIPVCYDAKLAPDLEDFLKAKKLKLEELITIHTKNEYPVFMRGFLPGFLYLGKVNKKLIQARKDVPLQNVPAGSVAIGGEQTGIYSLSSPGGWHIIGRTPIDIFDENDPNIMRISTNERVRFKAISLEEFRHLKAAKGKLKKHA